MDHGPGFVSEDTASVMARLRIRLIHGTPAYPEGHGKVERFHRTEFEQLLRLLDGVHFWVPVKQAQELLELGAMEPLDLAVSLRVGGCAMNEPDAQARHDRGGVLGDEAWAVVHEQGPEEAVTLDKPVQAVEEKAGTLGGADDHLQAHARGIVEEVQRHSPGALDACAEVLAVAKDHQHAVGVREPPHVPLEQALSSAQRQSHAPARSPEALTAQRLVLAEDAATPRPLDELGSETSGSRCSPRVRTPAALR